MRKGGGEEVRSVRCMCDVCAAHGDRAAVGVDVDAQGSSLREDESNFPLNARVLVLVFFINPIGAFELTRGVSSSNLGTNPSTTPFFERGHHLSSSRWLYRTPPTLVGRLQLTPA